MIPSRSAVNRAGRVLRKLRKVGPSGSAAGVTLEELSQALDTLEAWRAAHARPLSAAAMGLRSRASTVGCVQIEVSQRLKRVPTIIDKLHREPEMELGRMSDIGGCRVILRNLDEVARVQERYAGDPVTRRIRDYVTTPKPDGYRAIHVIVRYQEREIEVQVRTQLQHEWAYTVESVTSRFGLDIKSGGGPPPVRAWFAAVSEAIASEETGRPADLGVLRHVATLRKAAQPYLRGER